MWVYIIFTIFTISLASGNAFTQIAKIQKISRQEQYFLVSITEQAPTLRRETTLVFLMDQMGNRVLPNERVASNALSYLYFGGDENQRLFGFYCFRDQSNCIFSETGLVYKSSLLPSVPDFNPDMEYPYRNLVVFKVEDSGDTHILNKIPVEFLDNTSARIKGYQPYDNIVYVPFPIRPQLLFETQFSPDPARTSPADWKGLNLTLNDRRVCDESKDGHCSLHLHGSNGPPPYFYQQIEADGYIGQPLNVKVWIKSKIENTESLLPSLKFIFMGVDGNTNQKIVPLMTNVDRWVELDLIVNPEMQFDSFIFQLNSGFTSNDIWIDDIRIYLNGSLLYLLNPSFEDAST